MDHWLTHLSGPPNIPPTTPNGPPTDPDNPWQPLNEPQQIPTAPDRPLKAPHLDWPWRIPNRPSTNYQKTTDGSPTDPWRNPDWPITAPWQITVWPMFDQHLPPTDYQRLTNICHRRTTDGPPTVDGNSPTVDANSSIPSNLPIGAGNSRSKRRRRCFERSRHHQKDHYAGIAAQLLRSPLVTILLALTLLLLP